MLLRRRGAAPGARALCPHNRRWAGTLQSPAPAHPAGLGGRGPLRLRTLLAWEPTVPCACAPQHAVGRPGLVTVFSPSPRVRAWTSTAARPRAAGQAAPARGGRAGRPPPAALPLTLSPHGGAQACSPVLGPRSVHVPRPRQSPPCFDAHDLGSWCLLEIKTVGKPAAAADAGRIRTPSGGYHPEGTPAAPGDPHPRHVGRCPSAPGTWPVPVHPVTAVRPPGPPAPACCAPFAGGAPTTLSRVRGAPPLPLSSQRLLRHRLSLSRRRCPRAPLLATELKWAPKGGAEEWARAGSLMRPRRDSEPAGGAVRVREWRRRPAGMRPPAGPCGPLSSLPPAPRYSAWS